MDNMDTCCLEDQKNMDSNKVWQWRIICGKKHPIRVEPFLHSNRIGLDFNVASNTRKNIDLQLVTNGVILEVCDFAKTVNNSKGHFITNILENNFDLGLENEQQLTDFTTQILHKVKHLSKKPPKDKKDVFTLFDTSSKPKCKTNNGLNMVSGNSCLVEMDDSGHGDENACSQAASKEYMKTESLLEDMEGAHGDDGYDEEEFKDSRAMSAEELMEDAFLPKFPYCEEICLNLDVGSKQSLDPGLLTKGVMLELEHFTKILTSSFRLIVLGVLEHNFELDLKSQQGKNQIWLRILHLLKRRDGLITTGSEISKKFKNEPFSFQTNPLKRTRGSALSNKKVQQNLFQEVTKRRNSGLQSALLAINERANKGHRKGRSKDLKTNTLSHHTELCTRTAEGKHCQTGSVSGFDLDSNTGSECDKEQQEIETENYHTCPQGASDLDSDHKSSLSSDISRESKASCRNACAPFLILTDILSSLPVNTNTKSLKCQLDEIRLGGGDKQTQTLKYAPTEWDMEQEEMETENNMWKLRAKRVKQILSAEELGPFNKSKKCGLQFNVGFSPRKDFSIDSLTDSILLEIAKFALAMNSSQQNFIMEILEYNFDISLESEYQRNNFTCDIMKRVRQLKDCEDAVKFSKEVFDLHGPIPSISMANQSEASGNAEFPPHSQAETKEHISLKSVDRHPFCKEISLKLHVNNTRPNKKLDINKLTYGAMTEVTNFAERLCGTFEQICVDILKHNLDLDSQCGDSDLARSIVARLPVVIERHNLSINSVICHKRTQSMTNVFDIKVKQDSQNNPNPDAASSSQEEIINQEVNSSPDIECQSELNLKLWQLRENHIQQIHSKPHEEHCPLYAYSRCKKLGIDFNVGSGVKQNLDPKLLTNGIMIELHTFATALLSAQKHFITEILEYNFHLDLNNELYRSAFVQKTMRQIYVMNKTTKCKIPRNKMQFYLPDTKCMPEPACWRLRYCPKCYQVRNQKHLQGDYDSGHMHHPRPHTMTDAGSADANCSAQKPRKDPSSTFPAIEEMIMDNYPRCKKIGLSLCVDKDRPTDKLDMHVLTHGVMKEVAHYAKKMCGTKYKILNDLLQHNFNTDIQDINTVLPLQKVIRQHDIWLDWLSEVFDIQPRKKPGHKSLCEEAITKRKLALQTQKKTAKTNPLSKGNQLPIFTKMSLKSGEEEKLDFKLMSKSMGDMEQEEMAADNYYTCPLGESDLDSDELSDSENVGNQDHLQNPKSCSLSSDIARESEASCRNACAPFLILTDILSSLPVNTNTKSLKCQLDEIRLGGGDKQKQTLKYAPTESDMGKEEMETENNMWKLRAKRVKQILSAEELGPFNKSKKFGLQFNIGFSPKKDSRVDSLTDSILLEIAKFALAMNSSQQNFIMEILEYNFDISLESEYQRNNFTCDIMKRVRQLKDCEDAVKFSKEVFDLHGPIPSISMANQSEASGIAEFPPHSQAETKEHISLKSVDLHPFRKEISLKLHVNNTRPNKKLDINKLTYGAMTEVTHFAERLCGTFEQICVDILKHNLDLDSQCGDSDLARSIVARIPALLEQKKLSSYLKSHNINSSSINDSSTIVKLDYKNNSTSDATTAGSSQAAIIDQDVNGSPDMKHQNEFELKLWQLRENHIQEILSIPHEEHCPMYSYSRCKKVDIDFNVGSGVKQNLDPKLLTNGIMIELCTFARALLSAQNYFITEILEYNFHLDFNNELYRSAFALQTLAKIRSKKLQNKHGGRQMKTQFELPDTRLMPIPTLKKTLYCPRCYQVRNQKHLQGDYDSGHMHHPRPHTMTDAGSADANCYAQKPAKDPSSTFPAIEEMIMDNYPRCKKIGLSLCVDKDRPKDKLDMHVLTHCTIGEVASFAKRLCGSKYAILNDVIKHNFNIRMQGPDVNPATEFHRVMRQSHGLLSWLNEVFVIHRLSNKQLINVHKMKRAAAIHGSELKETIKKRKLALQTQEKTLKTYPLSQGNRFLISTKISLTPGEKEKLDLKQITKSVCDMDQEEMAPDNYYTCPLGESDLDSDELTDSENSGKLRPL